MKFLFELYQRNPLLTLVGMLMLSLFVLFGFFSFLDERVLYGVSIWNKPMKFSISIAIFLWTMAWLMDELPQLAFVEKTSRWLIALMSVEIIIISIQAARGVPSHFNITTWYDAALFNIMGLAIFINTWWVFRVMLAYGKLSHLEKAYRWGVQFGMLIFILSSLEGYVMAARLGHTVGAADGGPGLPFFGWARDFGDLRVAHFVGLHALQILPLFAWYVARNKPFLVSMAGILYLAFVGLSFVIALQGHPLWAGLL